MLQHGMDATARAHGSTLRIEWQGCSRPALYQLVEGDDSLSGDMDGASFRALLRDAGIKRVECAAEEGVCGATL